MDTSILQTLIVMTIVVQTPSQFAAPGQYVYPQMPGQIQGQMHLPMAHPGPMPMVPSQPLPLNAPFPLPPQRLPVVVMPFHSKVADRKYRRRRRSKKKHFQYSSSSSSSSESSSSSKEYLRSKKQQNRRKQKRQVLTPVISYVTGNGDVVYQKKLNKDNAGDWLELGMRKVPSKLEESKEIDSQEMTLRDLKQKFGLKKKHKHRH